MRLDRLAYKIKRISALSVLQFIELETGILTLGALLNTLEIPVNGYRIRGGIEGTNSGLKRKTGLGRLRVPGRPRLFHSIVSGIICRIATILCDN